MEKNIKIVRFSLIEESIYRDKTVLFNNIISLYYGIYLNT